MLPAAVISHKTSNRLRIKITSRKGDVDYFSNLLSGLKKEFNFKAIKSNALTGSILIQNSDLDLDAIAAYVSSKGICQLDTQHAQSRRLVDALIVPVKEINNKFSNFSRDEIDIHEVVFIALCSFGIFEIIRGNFRTPPWYTAFWYAFGIFTKSIVDRSARHQDGER